MSLADHTAVAEALSVLKTAKRPLVIIGKGSIKSKTSVSPTIRTFQPAYAFRPSVRAVNLISRLDVIATGAAYSRAETVLREFVELTGLPFLPTPMGKGVLPDDHPNCVAAARSRLAPLTEMAFLKVMDDHVKYKHLLFSFLTVASRLAPWFFAEKSSPTG